jgi:RAD51-like protein 2
VTLALQLLLFLMIRLLCYWQVALIVLDSATFHFRQAFPDPGQRTRLMTNMAQQLASLAEQHGVAVVMMNQVRCFVCC